MKNVWQKQSNDFYPSEVTNQVVDLPLAIYTRFMKKSIIITSLLFVACCKPSNTIVSTKADTSVLTPKYIDLVNVKPIPYNTKFKVSDKVCAWGKKTGVVLTIRFSTNPPPGHPDVLIYEVKFYDQKADESEDFYGTELEAGECK